MVNISLVQFTPVWNDVPGNLQQIASLLKGVQTDIIVLPELCTTGYSFITREEAINAAEDLSDESIAFFKQLAKEYQAMVIAGFVEKSADKIYNAALIALPNGEVKSYRKTHLFFREKECFNEGDSGFFVVEHPLKDCKVGIMICNDWRYPEAARSLALLGADVIACPSNLVTDVWRIGLPARALENKVFVAVTNRCGTEIRQLEDGSTQTLTFTGGSVLYNFTGEPIEQADKTEERVITLQIDPTLTRDKHFTVFNDLLNDRRPEYYLS
ncbi:nitrilase-related carbon-nitrogen hydrolase [Mucilaginibacter sp. X4EP1]|uniref:nitrilase-related carbon-nitrogen hydrolase n=1 Tax=Mucilaginibacter sp. X4EP1 TaxID=2723092 RepID=UPI002168B436|nr:nitrilase-related carbon-nitrogen hydrolase [Mucilaginibacter sp. X4EP1]MCS3814698.1 putative amidohydrolase [Mucilaginibacter sp. X4EP1]